MISIQLKVKKCLHHKNVIATRLSRCLRRCQVLKKKRFSGRKPGKTESGQLALLLSATSLFEGEKNSRSACFIFQQFVIHFKTEDQCLDRMVEPNTNSAVIVFTALWNIRTETKSNSHPSNTEAKPRAHITWPFLNSTIHNYSYLLVIVIKAMFCITAVAVACVFTVIFYLRLHWITAKRAHPFSPVKQESKNWCQILSAILSNDKCRESLYLETSFSLGWYNNSRQSEAHCTRYSSIFYFNLIRSIIISDSYHCTVSVTEKKKTQQNHLQ